MSRYTFKVCNPMEDREAIADFLFAIREELYLPDRQVCQDIAELCFVHGGVIAGYDGSRIVAMTGYFYGEPQCDYVNKETAFMYVAGIREEYRLTRVFLQGLIFSLQEFQMAGAAVIKLQAEASNPYNNKLYGRFARPIARSKTLRGIDVITYSGSIQDALNYLQRGRRKRVLTKSADEVLTPVR